MLKQYKILERKTEVFNYFTCNFSKEYETVRKQHEEVKQIRDQAREELKNLKEMQSPLMKKMEEIEGSFKSLDRKIRCMVGNLSSVIIFRCSLFRFAKCKSIIFLSNVP